MNKEEEMKALKWWSDLNLQRFDLLKKYGYQNEKKPWIYKPLTNKGIFLIWLKETRLTNIK